MPAVPTVTPDTDLALVRRWCLQRISDRARDQLRFEYTVRGRSVTIVERRVPWNAPSTEFGPAWTARPIAQLRLAEDGWRLYWPDSTPRWHLIDDLPAAVNVTPLLEAVDDPHRAFHG